MSKRGSRAPNWRHVHFGDETWDWRVVRGLVFMRRSPGGDICKALAGEVKGIRHDLVERGRWKGTSDGMVTPSEVKSYIDEKLRAIA